MPSPGTLLRELRMERGLTLRDVEGQSAAIARKLRRKAYIVAVGRLSAYENGKGVPSVYKMYSLASIYGCPILELLSLYGIPEL